MFTVREYQGADGKTLKYGMLFDKDRPESGRPLLFVPGLGGSVKGAIDFLENLLPYYSPIYGPDLRGFGLNLAETPEENAGIIRQDLEAFHKQLGLDNHPSLALCGISMGGVLSTLMASEHPERYTKLILLAPAFRAHPKMFSLKYKLSGILGHYLRGKSHRVTLPYGVEALTRNEAILNDPLYRDMPPLPLRVSFLLSVEKFNNQAFARMRTMKLPVQMFIPGQDIVCDPAAMREAFSRLPAGIPRMLKEYPDFYHDVLFETGHSEIAEEILNWSRQMDAETAASL